MNRRRTEVSHEMTPELMKNCYLYPDTLNEWIDKERLGKQFLNSNKGILWVWCNYDDAEENSTDKESEPGQTDDPD